MNANLVLKEKIAKNLKVSYCDFKGRNSSHIYFKQWKIWFTEIDHCAANPCENEGQCVNGENSYQCKCKPGFEGGNCEISKWMWYASL